MRVSQNITGQLKIKSTFFERLLAFSLIPFDFYVVAHLYYCIHKKSKSQVVKSREFTRKTAEKPLVFNPNLRYYIQVRVFKDDAKDDLSLTDEQIRDRIRKGTLIEVF